MNITMINYAGSRPGHKSWCESSTENNSKSWSLSRSWSGAKSRSKSSSATGYTSRSSSRSGSREWRGIWYLSVSGSWSGCGTGSCNLTESCSSAGADSLSRIQSIINLNKRGET